MPQIDRVINLLVVSPLPDVSSSLRGILAAGNWMVDAVADLEHAGRVLHNSSIDVVLAESEFPDGKNWRDFLEQMNRMPAPPPLIVFSPHADERLWAEVLNLGGYDLLLQPFDADETIRVLGLAARHAQAPRAAPAA